jgi:hypothetical protein
MCDIGFLAMDLDLGSGKRMVCINGNIVVQGEGLIVPRKKCISLKCHRCSHNPCIMDTQDVHDVGLMAYEMAKFGRSASAVRLSCYAEFFEIIFPYRHQGKEFTPGHESSLPQCVVEGIMEDYPDPTHTALIEEVPYVHSGWLLAGKWATPFEFWCFNPMSLKF